MVTNVYRVAHKQVQYQGANALNHPNPGENSHKSKSEVAELPAPDDKGPPGKIELFVIGTNGTNGLMLIIFVILLIFGVVMYNWGWERRIYDGTKYLDGYNILLDGEENTRKSSTSRILRLFVTSND